MKYFCVGLIALIMSNATYAQEAKLCHIAGMGFYATDGQQGVLMDALFADGMDGDPIASQSLNAALEGANGEFNDVSLIIASHIHEDHMKAKPILRHMRANKKARVILPEQARLLMLAAGIDPSEDRILYSSLKPGETQELNDQPFPVTLYGLSHGEGSEVDNIGIKVTVGTKTIMQVGDMYGIQKGLGEQEKISVDYLILPFWYFNLPQRVEYINSIFEAEHIIPAHFSLDTSEWMLAQGGIDTVKKRVFAAANNLIQLDQEMMCLSLD